jgi:arabinogalactan endo-1,4-beta-galactosidase
MRCCLALGSVVLAAPWSAPAHAPGADVDHDAPILGVDLSYVNEVEDCGAAFSDGAGGVDVFAILAEQGANLVRARLWHDPQWTAYSTVDDVIRTFRRAEANGMRTLLDFHYSDEWADPGRQSPPAAWAEVSDIDELAGALAAYTTETLARLDSAGVVPDMVQIGNETNGGLVKPVIGLDWEHDLPLFEAGIGAVGAFSEATGRHIDTIVHIAQPDNALAWFDAAKAAGLTDFDVIGLSYYPQWSSFTPAQLGAAVHALATTYGKEVLVVETGYPWTLESAGDTADNILDQALRTYDISPAGQAAFMNDLTATVVANDGLGTVYWEPAWVSTPCRTRWGQGSHWENATLFDLEGRLHAGADYLGGDFHPLAVPVLENRGLGDAAGDADDDADLIEISAATAAGATAITATIAGDIRRWPGTLIAAIDTEQGSGGDGGRRPFDFAEQDRPELLLETAWRDDPGPGYVSVTPSAWSAGGWQAGTFIGRVVVADAPRGGTTVTWVVPSDVAPAGAGVAVMTARRGRAGALADVVGSGSSEQAVGMAIEVDSSEPHADETTTWKEPAP